MHPDEVAQYIDPAECQLSYNPLQMALIWEAMATRDVSLLAQALERRHNIPDGHVLGELRPEPRRHRLDVCRRGRRRAGHQRLRPPEVPELLLRQPLPGQLRPRRARSRTTPGPATAAFPARRRRSAGWRADAGQAVDRILLAHSVAFSTGGIPLLYLGDEVGQLNDYDYALEDGHGTDSRWVHRPHFPAARYARRHDTSTPEGAVFAGLRNMIAVRVPHAGAGRNPAAGFRHEQPGCPRLPAAGRRNPDPGPGQLQRRGPDGGGGDALRIRRLTPSMS